MQEIPIPTLLVPRGPPSLLWYVRKGRTETSLSDPHFRSGPMIPPREVYPHAGSTLMDVCLHSFSSHLVVLTGIAALPTVYYFLQSTVIYIGGDPDAFTSRYPSPTTRVVSLGFLPCQLFADSFPRRSSSFISELFDLASALSTNLHTRHLIRP
jgi:hypothetical protein